MIKNAFKYGWSFIGIVELAKEWCVVCARQCWHETADIHKCCLRCANVVDMEQGPALQIERFIREEIL